MYVHTIATFVGIPIDAMQHQPLELLQAFWTYHMKTSNFGSLPTTLQCTSSLTQTHLCHLSSSPPQLQYSGKLSREKTFAVLWLFTKVFLMKFRGIVSFGAAICKSFLHENRIFHQFVKVFFLKSFPLYDIISCSTSSPTHTLSNDSLQWRTGDKVAPTSLHNH